VVRRALLVIAAIVAGLFVLGAISVPVLSQSDRGSTEYAGQTVRRVEITSERGAVRLRPGEPRVDQRRSWILSAPDVTHSVEDGVLRVDVACPGWAFISCSADLEVSAPAAAEVQVRAIEGDVVVEGVTGATDVSSEDGAVDVRASRAAVITARSVTEPVTVDALRAPSRVTARSETGTVTVRVPAGAYRVTADSGEGVERVTGVRTDPSAPRRIEATSGLRDVTVTGR